MTLVIGADDREGSPGGWVRVTWLWRPRGRVAAGQGTGLHISLRVSRQACRGGAWGGCGWPGGVNHAGAPQPVPAGGRTLGGLAARGAGPVQVTRPVRGGWLRGGNWPSGKLGEGWPRPATR